MLSPDKQKQRIALILHGFTQLLEEASVTLFNAILRKSYNQLLTNSLRKVSKGNKVQDKK